MTTPLVFIDTETTGLIPGHHQAYEVAWAIDDGPIRTATLPHTLENADPFALTVGKYHERGFSPSRDLTPIALLLDDLEGVTLVGSNPSFDAAFLRESIGCAPWHHRLIDVAQGGMWVFGWDRPQGLAATVEKLRILGYEIPEPDHTAAGDVAATRAVYNALMDID